MTKTVCALIAVTMLAAPVAAADKPNFSGSWKMNLAKSNFGPAPPPESITRAITHAEPSITIDEEQLTAFGLQKTLRKYTTDGKEMTFESQGAQVSSSAVWKDNVLVVVSTVAVANVQFVDRMTLSDDGKTLMSDVHVATPQGDVDVKVVFDKQ